jgi:hypothetical protein
MESEIKGLSLRNYPIVLRAMRGDEIADRLLASLSPELRDGLGMGKIIASGWYPVAYKRELHQAGAKVTGEPGFARIISNEMTKSDLTGIYRTFVRIARPRFVLSLASRIFSTYFRPGLMRVVERRDGFVKVQLSHCFGFDANMWQDVFGGCEAALELAGAKTCRIRVIDGGGDGDHSASANAWWREDENDSLEPPP